VLIAPKHISIEGIIRCTAEAGRSSGAGEKASGSVGGDSRKVDIDAAREERQAEEQEGV
jgi:hypothetical protein